jgi:uncharacterized damage-inducible protein DinB
MSDSIELSHKLEASFADLLDAAGQLDDEERVAADLGDGWTAAAVLAHVAYWDDFQTRRMQAALSGASAAAGFARGPQNNEERRDADRVRSFDDALRAAETARAALVEFVSGLSPEQLETKYPEGHSVLYLSGLVRHMVQHAREHARQIEAYCGSMRRWSKADLRTFLLTQHDNLMKSIAGLDETTIVTTEVTPGWTIRDTLVHVLAWHEYAYDLLRTWPEPSDEVTAKWAWIRETGSIDATNQRLLEQRAELDMIAIADGLMTYHRRFLRLLDQADEATLSSSGTVGTVVRAMSSLFYDAAGHETEHAATIWQWRSTRG